MKKLIKNTFYLAGSNVFSFFISAIGGFVIAKILGPEDYGGYSAYKLFVSYAICLQLGILQGLQREIPFLRAKNEKENLTFLLNTAFTFIFLVSFIGIVILFIASLHSSPFFKKVFLITIPFIPFFFFKEFYRFSMRGLEKFGELSLLNVIDAISIFLIVVLFSLYFKGEGAVFGFAITNFLYFIFAYYFTKIIFFKFKIHLKSLKSLFFVGFPIFIVGFLNIIIFSLDRLFILGLIGRKGYGIYAIALNFLNLIYQIPIAMSLVLLPYLTRKKAIEGSVSRFVIKNYYILPLFLVFLSILIFFFYPPVVFVIKNFLHKYEDSLPVLKLLLSLILFPSINYFFYSFLIAENKHFYIVPYHLALLPLTLILNSVLIPKFQLSGAALAFIGSQTLFTIILILLAYRFIKFHFIKTVFSLIMLSLIHFFIFNLIF